MNTQKKGFFIALEGIEGSGKSLQARLLVENLRSIGYTVQLIREPGSTPIGEEIRNILLNTNAPIPTLTELFLFMASRSAFIEQLVEPGISDGQIIVADRFHLSSLAYQGAGRGIDLNTIDHIGHHATKGITPDITFLIDIPYEVGKKRQVLMGKSADRIESESSDFHNRVRNGYKDLANRIKNIKTIDGIRPIEEVSASILEVVLPLVTLENDENKQH